VNNFLEVQKIRNFGVDNTNARPRVKEVELKEMKVEFNVLAVPKKFDPSKRKVELMYLTTVEPNHNGRLEHHAPYVEYKYKRKKQKEKRKGKKMLLTQF
jgi:hypothetical protein